MNPSNSHVTGTLELGQNGSGFLRDPARNYAISPNDPLVQRDIIQKMRLRGGETITGEIHRGKHGRGQPMLGRIESISGTPPEQYSKVTPFDDLPVVHPEGKLTFETPGGPMSTRIIDLLAPIGKGQRGLIVAPPRT